MQTTKERARVLWVDLRLCDNKHGDYDFPDAPWELHRCIELQQIDEKIIEISPRLVCFDFGYPDTSGLAALEQTIQHYPELPVVMVTGQHSEDLAVWALRSGVQDYLVKPVTEKAIVACAERLSKQDGCISHNPIPDDLKFRAPQTNKVHLAKVFVEDHYHERVRARRVAEYCGMSSAAFARCFKDEYSMTFREYLTRFRMDKAKKMLLNPNASVTDVVYAIGFSDPSYFTRMFRRFTGFCPSCYRDAQLASAEQQRYGSRIKAA